jgi:hypothetical protein
MSLHLWACLQKSGSPASRQVFCSGDPAGCLHFRAVSITFSKFAFVQSSQRFASASPVCFATSMPVHDSTARRAEKRTAKYRLMRVRRSFTWPYDSARASLLVLQETSPLGHEGRVLSVCCCMSDHCPSTPTQYDANRSLSVAVSCACSGKRAQDTRAATAAALTRIWAKLTTILIGKSIARLQTQCSHDRSPGTSYVPVES